MQTVHNSLHNSGFDAYSTNTAPANISDACNRGELSCEQFTFLYLLLLQNKLERFLGTSLLADKLAIITMFNPQETHVVLANKEELNSCVWETMATRSNRTPLKTYRGQFQLFQIHNINEALSTALELFKLDFIKNGDKKTYLRRMREMEQAGRTYPSRYFYSIEIVNLLAEQLETNTLSPDEQQHACAEALARLEKLRACPYLEEQDIEGNIAWFKQVSWSTEIKQTNQSHS